jgi:hypothetical protein
MAEGGANFESFMGAPQGAEKAQETQEQFQERQRQAAAAAQKAKAEEKKAKAQDDALARLISQFLKNGKRSAHFLLLARLLARNIPSDFLLATIALIEPSIEEYITEKLEHLPPAKNLQKSEGGVFPPAVKAAIDRWTNGISLIARSEARRLVQTALDSDDVPTSGLTQLFVLVLREYLEANHSDAIPAKNLRAFAELFWQKLFTDLKKLAGDEHRLSDGVK